MLYITIPAQELFDQRTNRFITIKKDTKLQLEHSLVSVSKWESKWKEPFFNDKQRTLEQTRDYVRCMTITQNVHPDVYFGLTRENLKAVSDYIHDSMTATWFREDPDNPQNRGPKPSKITSELIYYWMTVANIPFECEKWHLNRLLTLIRIYNEKNKDPKKMSKADRQALNNQRRAASKARHH